MVPSVKDWVRGGDCNGCGWCCQMVTRMEVGVQWHPKIDEHYYQVRGFKWKEVDGVKLGFISGSLHAPCPMHDNVGMSCKIYETRPDTCRQFPLTPDQIVNSPCSYWFERPSLDGRSTERIGGDSSPWPGHTVKPNASTG